MDEISRADRDLADACARGDQIAANVAITDGARNLQFAIMTAVKFGRLDLAVYIIGLVANNYAFDFFRALELALEYNRPDMAHWATTALGGTYQRSFLEACRKGVDSVLRWHESLDVLTIQHVLDGIRAACKGDQYDIAVRLANMDPANLRGPTDAWPMRFDYALAGASFAGILKIAIWARANKATNLEESMCIACARDNLNVAKYLKSEGAGDFYRALHYTWRYNKDDYHKGSCGQRVRDWLWANGAV